MRPIAFGLVMSALLGVARGASATPPPPPPDGSRSARPSYVPAAQRSPMFHAFMPGAVIGAANGDPIAGAEVSVAWLGDKEHNDPPIPMGWFGFYADGVYDAAVARGRFTFGPELGTGPFGIDGGVAVQTSGKTGGTVRLLFTAGFVAAYSRWLYLDDPRVSGSGPVHEFGLLFKLPFVRSDRDGWRSIFIAYEPVDRTAPPPVHGRMKGRRATRALGLGLLCVPLAVSLSARRGTLVGSAAACTGAPVFDASAVTILPERGAVVPKNARVWFVPNARAHHYLATRPTWPVSVRTRGKSDCGLGLAMEEKPVALLDARAGSASVRPALVGDTDYQVSLPSQLPERLEPGVAQPRTDELVPSSVATTFRTLDVDDLVPPVLTYAGEPRFESGGNSCVTDRLTLTVRVFDTSPTLVRVVDPDAEGAVPALAAVIGETVTLFDIGHTAFDARVWSTRLVVTPIDIAGNEGAPWTVNLGRGADGGAPLAETRPLLQEQGPRGCGKF